MKERKELYIKIGERIKHSREIAGYTQEKLADLTDVSIQYISDLERGIVGTSIPKIEFISFIEQVISLTSFF